MIRRATSPGGERRGGREFVNTAGRAGPEAPGRGRTRGPEVIYGGSNTASGSHFPNMPFHRLPPPVSPGGKRGYWRSSSGGWLRQNASVCRFPPFPQDSQL
ncbi:hypothetical protein EYF80_052437 [Liparis tanakae]|uniref:Uncharacterized protein n=1 Tax=Liparis tanakae TaxID=230148 RepID=A0A4Z2F8W4_9TELE|nr:hypothetical protein EYF80_052437 [Liparis tanakae]